MIRPQDVHSTLARHQLADGMPMVMDLERSHGSWMVDARDGREYLDFFTCFASWPIGYNHPRMSEPDFRDELMVAALNNPSNSDLYTVSMARFVETFAEKVTPAGFPHHFWVAGGALAVENAMKTAFDWKARKLGRAFDADVNDLSILHFRQAFHGRSGYTMSVTNTDPTKTALFPKFDWPRVSNAAIEFDLQGEIANDVEALEAQSVAEIEQAFADRNGTIAAILIEPMQGEGGDNHFRHEYLQKLRELADKHEALLMFDEVQTGFFGSGTRWLWEQLCTPPDVCVFSKKSQVGGFFAGRRIEEVSDHVFAKSSRINSTWGGNLVDMVRARQFIEIITGDGLAANVKEMGNELIGGLRTLAKERGGMTNVRGVGSLVAFTLDSRNARDTMLTDLAKKGLLALASGPNAIRFRLPLVIEKAEIDAALERVADCLPARV